ncbi:Epidermal growth factor receptor pathway substrate 15 like 1 [Balamuthia mandrillaris]
MSSGNISQHLLPQEKEHYDALFLLADGDKDGRIGPADAQFLLQFGLEKKKLSEIWQLADSQRKGSLDREAFYIALRLISLARQGKPLTAPQHAPPFFAPEVTTVGINAPGSNSGAPLSNSKPASEEDWVISPQERAKFTEIFEKADEKKTGFVTGAHARDLFSRSGLDRGDLGKIWTLSDQNKDGRLDKEEFIIAMYLINARLKGRTLPDVLPASILNSGSSPSTMAAPLSGGAPLGFQPSPLSQGAGGAPPGSWGAAPPSSLPHGTDLHSAAATWSGAATKTIAQPASRGSPLTSHGSSVAAAGSGGLTPPGSFGFSHPVPVPSADDQWVITADQRQKYESIFERADETKAGRITGEQARTLFSRSNLGVSDLAKIWALSDIDKDGQLNKEEFMVAMFLINAKLKGLALPDTLPPTLNPYHSPAPSSGAPPSFSSPSYHPPSSSSSSAAASSFFPSSDSFASVPKEEEPRMKKLEDVKLMVAAEQKKRDEERRKVEEERKRREAIEAELNALNSTFQKLNSEVQKLQSDLEAEKKRSSTAKANADLLKQQIDGLTEQRKSLKSLYDERLKQKQEADKLEQMLQQQIKENQDIVNRQKQEMKNLDDAIAASQRKREELKNKSAELHKTQQQQQKQLFSLQESSAKLQQEVMLLEGQAANAAAQSKLLAEQMAAVERERAQLAARNKAAASSSTNDFFGGGSGYGSPSASAAAYRPPQQQGGDFFGSAASGGVDSNVTADFFGASSFGGRGGAASPSASSSSSSFNFSSFGAALPSTGSQVNGSSTSSGVVEVKGGGDWFGSDDSFA